MLIEGWWGGNCVRARASKVNILGPLPSAVYYRQCMVSRIKAYYYYYLALVDEWLNAEVGSKVNNIRKYSLERCGGLRQARKTWGEKIAVSLGNHDELMTVKIVRTLMIWTRDDHDQSFVQASCRHAFCPKFHTLLIFRIIPLAAISASIHSTCSSVYRDESMGIPVGKVEECLKFLLTLTIMW